MNINRMSCCNWGEIGNLGYGHNDGLFLMKQFIKILPKTLRTYDYKTHVYTDTLSKDLFALYTIYLFSGVVSRGRSTFNGKAFAEFIEKNKLGEITSTTPARNLGYHPESEVQGWMWVPNQKNLSEWARIHASEEMKINGSPNNNYWGSFIHNQVHKCTECKTCSSIPNGSQEK